MRISTTEQNALTKPVIFACELLFPPIWDLISEGAPNYWGDRNEIPFLWHTKKENPPFSFPYMVTRGNYPTEDFSEEEEQKERKRMKSVNGLETQPCSFHSQLAHHREECAVDTSPTVSRNLAALHKDTHCSEPELVLSWEFTPCISESHLCKCQGSPERWSFTQMLGRCQWQKQGFLVVVSTTEGGVGTNTAVPGKPSGEVYPPRGIRLTTVRRNRSCDVSWVMENYILPETHMYKDCWNNWSAFYVKS